MENGLPDGEDGDSLISSMSLVLLATELCWKKSWKPVCFLYYV